jgi:hypothetical protein
MGEVEQYKYQCLWNPKEDITTFELARCIPYTFSKLHSIEDWDKLDESITRHFTVTKFDYRDLINDTAAKLKEAFKK